MFAFGWLFFALAALLVVVYLFAPVPSAEMGAQSPSGIDDFQMPDNSSSRVIPKVYGTAYLKGNCIYYGGLESRAIYTETESSGGKK